MAIVTAVTTRTIRVAGADLFKLAAQYLGDATQWYRFAQLNDLTDPVVVGLVTLKIPSAGASNGGILGG